MDKESYQKVFMAHVRCWAAGVGGSLLMALSAGAWSATKMDEGFASQYDRNGRQSRPTDRISEGSIGKDAYYWIQWRDHPVGRSTFRCRVVHEAVEAPIVDEEITYAESTSEGFSLCGFTPRKDETREGLYTFTQYLDGVKVGEASLTIESRYFSDLKLFPWKIALLLFAVAILALAWIKPQPPVRRV